MRAIVGLEGENMEWMKFEMDDCQDNIPISCTLSLKPLKSLFGYGQWDVSK